MVFAVVVVVVILTFFAPTSASQTSTAQASQLNKDIQAFLEDKDSPLTPETELLLQQKHWKLLIAISAIESQYCKRQLGWNCWGIGGDSAYRKYPSIREAIVDANNLIEHWQQKGRWLTIEDMNCHYVVPCNPNWVKVVTQVLGEMNQYEQRLGTIY